jgi:chlorophyllide a reductase subunit Y
VGTGDASGVWQEEPKARPEFREAYKRKLEKAAAAKHTEEPV